MISLIQSITGCSGWGVWDVQVTTWSPGEMIRIDFTDGTFHPGDRVRVDISDKNGNKIISRHEFKS